MLDVNFERNPYNVPRYCSFVGVACHFVFSTHKRHQNFKKTYLLSYFVPLNTLHIIKGTTKTPTVDLLRLNTNSLGVSFFFFVFFVYFFPVHFEFLRGFFILFLFLFISSFFHKLKFIYSHLFSYNITTIKNKKEVKNRADYTLS